MFCSTNLRRIERIRIIIVEMLFDEMTNKSAMIVVLVHFILEENLQIFGMHGYCLCVHVRAEKDEIVQTVMNLKIAEIVEDYTMDVVISCLDLLMNMRDNLLFELEYPGNMREHIPPKSPIQIPWTWLSAALCLL